MAVLLSSFVTALVLMLMLSRSAAGAASASHRFEQLSYNDIIDKLQLFSAKYPGKAEVFTAQERYGVPSPGDCGQPCQQWILHITNLDTLKSDQARPEVFLSGCLHGNERIGPTTVVEVAELLLQASVCYSNNEASECQEDKLLAGDPETVAWLAHLVETRNIYIMPTANAWGYYHDKREENGVDPNRDFPFNQAPSACMVTSAARAINELWREHIFQLSLTFHAGMEAIAYEWGSKNHPHRTEQGGALQDVSPDDDAQVEIGTALSEYAGSFQGVKPYQVQSQNFHSQDQHHQPLS
ncbi:unnamed protein product [Chrysoparadoxa australica]